MENGGVAGKRPFRRIRLSVVEAAHKRGRLCLSERLRHGMRQFWQRHGTNRIVLAEASPLEKFVEHAQGTQTSRQASAAHLLSTPKGKEGAYVPHRQRQQQLEIDLVAEMAGEKLQKLSQIALV